jgi:hypothetical protein
VVDVVYERNNIVTTYKPSKTDIKEVKLVMIKDIRTPRGKLVGKLDERTGVLSIKDGGKVTLIEIPPCGLRLKFTSGDGVTADVAIPPTAAAAA